MEFWRGTPNLLFYGIAVFIYAISLPISLISYYQFYKNWNKTYFVQRDRKLVLSATIAFSVDIFIARPIKASLSYLYRDHHHAIPPPIEIWLYSFFMSLTYIVWLVYTLRIYKLYYDHKYHTAVNQDKWKLLIDPSNNANWFIRKKSTFGNASWLQSHTLLIWVILTSIHVALSIALIGTRYIELVTWGFSFLIFFACILTGCIVWKNFPSIGDEFEIRSELRIFIVYCLITLLIVIILTVLVYVHMVAMWLFHLVVPIGESIGLFISTYVVVLLNERKLANMRMIESFSQVLGQQHSDHAAIQNLSLEFVVSNRNGYSAIMDHFCLEFCTENLLFVTEYIQFKQSIERSKGMIDRENNIQNLEIPFLLPNSIPKSEIAQSFEQQAQSNGVYNKEDVVEFHDSFVNSAKLLHEKYISVRSLLEINISGLTRNKLTNFLNNVELGQCMGHNDIERLNLTDNKIFETINRILWLFDEALNQTTKLMLDSFYRFRYTKVAMELVKSMN